MRPPSIRTESPTGSNNNAKIHLASLLAIRDLLHLAAHRNKNQHRLAKWWGPFSMLRRHVGKLVTLLEENVDREQKKEHEQKTKELAVWIEDILVPRCYSPFSALVADNQYAALGLMLLATLARLNRVIACARSKEVGIGPDELPADKEGYNEGHVDTAEDVGEVVIRESMQRTASGTILSSDNELEVLPSIDLARNQARAAEALAEYGSLLQVTGVPTERPRKKKVKKSDAFDELFGALI
ncbi:MAG: hypothetical protein M1818_000134 [Claussenomyces sp. TS43310]|nr:MAG: hypothetical protein M1818_000134 [Claussenomyces sp. TS43310]